PQSIRIIVNTSSEKATNQGSQRQSPHHSTFFIDAPTSTMVSYAESAYVLLSIVGLAAAAGEAEPSGKRLLRERAQEPDALATTKRDLSDVSWKCAPRSIKPKWNFQWDSPASIDWSGPSWSSPSSDCSYSGKKGG
ncbi:hypothetical protein ACHAWF_000530, partial [Thalassiosira exigua]